MKTWTVLLLAMIAQAAGNSCLSRGMKAVGASASSLAVLVHGVEAPLVWLGTLLLLVFFALFLAVLSWEDLSFVLPVSSIGYVLNVAAARWLLGESVSLIRWTGTLLVMVGVALVSRTAREAQPRPQETRVPEANAPTATLAADATANAPAHAGGGS